MIKTCAAARVAPPLAVRAIGYRQCNVYYYKRYLSGKNANVSNVATTYTDNSYVVFTIYTLRPKGFYIPSIFLLTKEIDSSISLF